MSLGGAILAAQNDVPAPERTAIAWARSQLPPGKIFFDSDLVFRPAATKTQIPVKEIRSAAETARLAALFDGTTTESAARKCTRTDAQLTCTIAPLSGIVALGVKHCPTGSRCDIPIRIVMQRGTGARSISTTEYLLILVRQRGQWKVADARVGRIT